MKLYINCKCDFKKADSITRKSICLNMSRLYEKMTTLEIRDINQIFNIDSVTYDRISNSVFLYKCHGINSTQLRIVYSVQHTDSDISIYLIDFVSKTKNNKDYIKRFNKKYSNRKIADFDFFDATSYVNTYTK